MPWCWHVCKWMPFCLPSLSPVFCYYADRINTTHFPINGSGSDFCTPFELVYGKHAGISLPLLVADSGSGSVSENGEEGLRKEGEMGTLEVLSSTHAKSKEERLIITGYDYDTHVQLATSTYSPQLWQPELAKNALSVWKLGAVTLLLFMIVNNINDHMYTVMFVHVSSHQGHFDKHAIEKGSLLAINFFLLPPRLCASVCQHPQQYPHLTVCMALKRKCRVI